MFIVKKNLRALFFNFIVVITFGTLLGSTFANANGNFAYQNGELYSVNPKTGNLTNVGYAGQYSHSGASLTFHPNGNFAYQNAVLYSVNPKTGNLTNVGYA